MSTFQKSENLVQILRNFFEDFTDRTKPRGEFQVKTGRDTFCTLSRTFTPQKASQKYGVDHKCCRSQLLSCV